MKQISIVYFPFAVGNLFLPLQCSSLHSGQWEVSYETRSGGNWVTRLLIHVLTWAKGQFIQGWAVLSAGQVGVRWHCSAVMCIRMVLFHQVCSLWENMNSFDKATVKLLTSRYYCLRINTSASSTVTTRTGRKTKGHYHKLLTFLLSVHFQKMDDM